MHLCLVCNRGTTNALDDDDCDRSSEQKHATEFEEMKKKHTQTAKYFATRRVTMTLPFRPF